MGHDKLLPILGQGGHIFCDTGLLLTPPDYDPTASPTHAHAVMPICIDLKAVGLASGTVTLICASHKLEHEMCRSHAA